MLARRSPIIDSTRRSARGMNSEMFSLVMGIGLGSVVLAALLMWMLRSHWLPTAAPVPSDRTTAATSVDASKESRPPPAATAPAVVVISRRAAAADGRWSQLTLDEQDILQPLHDDWKRLTTDQRVKWLDVVARFSKLTPDEQQRMQTRMAEWARLSPHERGQARLNFQELRQLSAKERLERWEAYQGLEEDERRQWAERTTAAASASPARRTEAPAKPQPKSAGSGWEAPTAWSRPEGASVVRAPLGATTHLVSRLPTGAGAVAPPAPRIASGGEGVDRRTLLPQSPKAARAPSGDPESPASGDGSGDAASSASAGAAGPSTTAAAPISPTAQVNATPGAETPGHAASDVRSR